MIYLTHRERRAIIMATGVALSIIIACVSIAASLGALWCPAGTFC
jgi:hypothetical protein